MAGPVDVIKEYLVSLGFKVDDQAVKKANKTIGDIGKNISKFADVSVADFAMAGAAVIGFVEAAVVGIAKFVDNIGNAEIGVEKLARQLWTSEQQARSFQAALSATGASLEDLYLSPTLMKQFTESAADCGQHCASCRL
ncbi:hypothetical protein LJK87_17375 [Paenibacillus sp. P25]|nr:hypothetical protein LJK87_50065 [Paenibacillus sp. P25]UUZ95986.1 hypothetical protein LJK87_17375 [Paenibacillus sp. P25]